MDISRLNDVLSILLPTVEPLAQIGGIEIEYNETTRTTTLRHIDPDDDSAVLILPSEVLRLTEYLLAIQNLHRKDAPDAS